MTGEDKDQSADSWHEIAFNANEFILSNSEKHLDYMIGLTTKVIFVTAFVFALLVLLLFVPMEIFSVSNWKQWPIFAFLWFVIGICASRLPLDLSKGKYKRFISRSFNYWPDERTEEALDDEIAKKEIVEYMNAAKNGIQYWYKGSNWSVSRRIYYKNKIFEQLELIELVLKIVAWTIGILFCIRLGIPL